MPQDICYADLKFIIEFVYKGEIDVSQAELQVSVRAKTMYDENYFTFYLPRYYDQFRVLRYASFVLHTMAYSIVYYLNNTGSKVGNLPYLRPVLSVVYVISCITSYK